MKKEIIKMSGKAPGPPRKGLHPYSAAVRAGDFIFVSGFHGGGSNPATGERYDTIEAQTTQCLEKIKHALEAGGALLEDVVKCTVFIAQEADLDKMNEAYAAFFPSDPPARSCVVTGFIRPGMMVQIDCTAYSPK
jgi:enamine deaminase RidA (YjgF/YER057c/UK114 family)